MHPFHVSRENLFWQQPGFSPETFRCCRASPLNWGAGGEILACSSDRALEKARYLQYRLKQGAGLVLVSGRRRQSLASLSHFLSGVNEEVISLKAAVSPGARPRGPGVPGPLRVLLPCSSPASPWSWELRAVRGRLAPHRASQHGLGLPRVPPVHPGGERGWLGTFPPAGLRGSDAGPTGRAEERWLQGGLAERASVGGEPLLPKAAGGSGGGIALPSRGVRAELWDERVPCCQAGRRRTCEAFSARSHGGPAPVSPGFSWRKVSALQPKQKGEAGFVLGSECSSGVPSLPLLGPVTSSGSVPGF